jgi:hypothetical protein
VLQGGEEGREEGAIESAQPAGVGVDTQDPDGLCADAVEEPGEGGVAGDEDMGDLAGPGARGVSDKGDASGRRGEAGVGEGGGASGGGGAGGAAVGLLEGEDVKAF